VSVMTKTLADITQSISAKFAGINGQMAKNIAEIARVPLDDWLTGLGPDDLAEDHPEPDVRTESGLIIPSPTETLIFGGFQIDPERAFFAVVLTGLFAAGHHGAAA
jgi:hypothetical protein